MQFQENFPILQKSNAQTSAQTRFPFAHNYWTNYMIGMFYHFNWFNTSDHTYVQKVILMRYFSGILTLWMKKIQKMHSSFILIELYHKSQKMSVLIAWSYDKHSDICLHDLIRNARMWELVSIFWNMLSSNKTFNYDLSCSIIYLGPPLGLLKFYIFSFDWRNQLWTIDCPIKSVPWLVSCQRQFLPSVLLDLKYLVFS